jgi:hypothetical protein
MLLARYLALLCRMIAHYLHIIRIAVQLVHKGNPKRIRGVPSSPLLRTTLVDLCEG